MSVFADIENALATKTDALSLPTAWQNATYTPTIGTLYIRPTLLPSSVQPLVISDLTTDRHSGVYQIDIIAPIETGRAEAVTKADTVADHFVRGTDLTSGSQTVTINSVSRGAGTRDGAWFVIPVEINFSTYT